MSKYRDNIYLAFIHVPDDLIVSVKRALAVTLRRIYQIPLKWEPHGDAVVWGEATLTPSMVDSGFSLTRKGIVTELSPAAVQQPTKWTRWVSCKSPNARSVWRSQFPSLVLKSIWYAVSPRDLQLSSRSLVWGMGWHSYPRRWWRPKLFALWTRYRLGRCFFMHTVDRWANEGAAFADTCAAKRI